jgi:hypothetical protein
MRNVDDLRPSEIKRLMKSFSKLRQQKFWKSNVAAGVAMVEVTNIGNGWHPHLHCVLDCRWLSVTTKPPTSSHSLDEKRELFRLAAIELESAWSKLLKQETSSVKIKRCDRTTIAKEVLKYTVKNEDLVLCEGRIGGLIRALDSIRTMRTFGRAHGQVVKDIRLAARTEMKRLRDLDAENGLLDACCPVPEFIVLDYETSDAVESARKRRVKVLRPAT